MINFENWHRDVVSDDQSLRLACLHLALGTANPDKESDVETLLIKAERLFNYVRGTSQSAVVKLKSVDNG